MAPTVVADLTLEVLNVKEDEGPSVNTIENVETT